MKNIIPFIKKGLGAIATITWLFTSVALFITGWMLTFKDIDVIIKHLNTLSLYMVVLKGTGIFFTIFAIILFVSPFLNTINKTLDTWRKNREILKAARVESQEN